MYVSPPAAAEDKSNMKNTVNILTSRECVLSLFLATLLFLFVVFTHTLLELCHLFLALSPVVVLKVAVLESEVKSGAPRVLYQCFIDVFLLLTLLF